MQGIPEIPVTDYSEIQEDIYAKVEAKFKKQRFLRNKKSLIFELYTVTYTTADIEEQEEYPLVKNVASAIKFIKETCYEEEFTDDKYNKIL